MRRREFIALLGAAAGYPLVARAEQAAEVRRIGILLSPTATDPEAPLRLTTFITALQELGWTDRRNLRIDFRQAAAANLRSQAGELVALRPDVLLAIGNPALTAAQQASRTIPTVFVSIAQPVREGFVPNRQTPGGNV